MSPVSTGDWTAGVVRMGNAPAAPSEKPLHRMRCRIVHRFPDGDVWVEAEFSSDSHYATAAEAQASLTARRKAQGHKVRTVPGGIEWDETRDVPGDGAVTTTTVTWEDL